MDQQSGAQPESEQGDAQAEERQAREREALRRRVRESLLRCPDANNSPRA